MRVALALMITLNLAITFALAAEESPAEKNGRMVRTVGKGDSITVNAFEEKTQAFLLTLNAETAVGPNYVEPDELRRAIDYEGSLRSFMKNKDKMIGAIYQLKKNMKLITETEMSRRRNEK